jgi:hypothetical protein
LRYFYIVIILSITYLINEPIDPVPSIKKQTSNNFDFYWQ